MNAQSQILVSGSDIDGIPRGKYLSLKKFEAVKSSGFGFCSVIFGWDMHDANCKFCL
jgi:glutamine synthetase